jgi:hypothetical protein
MNEIILAPCDVISKIKQNSSDMNEIILAPCDAGYVQSCIPYHIPYHGQKSDIISYPITRLKKIGYYILYPYLQKFHKISLFLKKEFFFGKVTKELFRILSIYIRS